MQEVGWIETTWRGVRTPGLSRGERDQVNLEVGGMDTYDQSPDPASDDGPRMMIRE